jgi:outer membrane usher protein
VQNLRDLELDPKLFGVDGVQEFDLDQVKGLSYSYDRRARPLRCGSTMRCARRSCCPGAPCASRARPR